MAQQPIQPGPTPPGPTPNQPANKGTYSKAVKWTALTIIAAIIAIIPTVLFTPVFTDTLNYFFPPSLYPPNTASGTIQVTYDAGGMRTLIVTGSFGGGKVCPVGFQGNSVTFSETGPYTFTETDVCDGTYKDGHISFSLTTTYYQAVFSDGRVCTLAKPYLGMTLQGKFVSRTILYGTYAFSTTQEQLKCKEGGNAPFPPESIAGTWRGVSDMA